MIDDLMWASSLMSGRVLGSVRLSWQICGSSVERARPASVPARGMVVPTRGPQVPADARATISSPSASAARAPSAAKIDRTRSASISNVEAASSLVHARSRWAATTLSRRSVPAREPDPAPSRSAQVAWLTGAVTLPHRHPRAIT